MERPAGETGPFYDHGLECQGRCRAEGEGMKQEFPLVGGKDNNTCFRRPYGLRMANGTTTRSPGLSVRTSPPTSTTSPMNSCPRISPSCMPGM